MAGLTKKGETYYALFSVNGKTKWKKIGKVSYSKAQAALNKLESDFEFNRIGFIDTKPPESFDKFLIRYLNYSKANKAHYTWIRDRSSIRNLSKVFRDTLLYTAPH